MSVTRMISGARKVAKFACATGSTSITRMPCVTWSVAWLIGVMVISPSLAGIVSDTTAISMAAAKNVPVALNACVIDLAPSVHRRARGADGHHRVIQRGVGLLPPASFDQRPGVNRAKADVVDEVHHNALGQLVTPRHEDRVALFGRQIWPRPLGQVFVINRVERLHQPGARQALACLLR